MNIIVKDSLHYPGLLKEISDAPKRLYYKGSWDKQIFENCLAVVGSRRMTSYGKQMVERLIGELAAAGITIVSGFMYGVDATSHKAALRVGGRTIAVMPCGINIISPEYQKDLYSEIIENDGLIISEYEKDKKPELWTYPRRNRIVAGLSKAVLVVEAGPKSGSLITANLAIKFKRKLFAVPGPATSEVSKGTLQLIKEGAEMVTSAKDILDYFSLRKQDFLNRFPLSTPYSSPRQAEELAPRLKKPVFSANARIPEPHDSKSSFSPHSAMSLAFCERSSGKQWAGARSEQNAKREEGLERKILDELQREPMEIDVLSRNLKVPTAKLGSMLSIMQLKGLIVRNGNKYQVNK